jgi:hypothetical protein
MMEKFSRQIQMRGLTLILTFIYAIQFIMTGAHFAALNFCTVFN